MTVTPQGSLVLTEQGSAGLAAFPVPLGPVVNVGELLIVKISGAGVAGTTPPAGWTQFAGAFQASSTSEYAFWKNADGTEGGTSPTFTLGAAGRATAFVRRFAGHDPTNPIDLVAVQGQNTGTGSSCTMAGFSTITDKAFLITGCVGDAATGPPIWTVPPGFTNMVQSTGTGKGSAWAEGVVTVSPAGPVGPTVWQWNQSNLRMNGWVAAIRPAPLVAPAAALAPLAILNRVGDNSGYLTTNLSPISPFDSQIGQRTCTFRWDLIEAATGRVVRTLTPYRDSVPTIVHDTTRSIKRTVEGLFFSPDDTAAIDTIKHRIRPYMVMPDGTSYGFGEFLFGDNSRNLISSNIRRSAPTMLDTSFIIDQQRATSFPEQQTVQQVAITKQLQNLMQEFPTVAYALEASPYATNNSWSYGTTSLQVALDLATLGDFFSPWIDNNSTFRFIRSFDPAKRVPDIDWDRYDHVLSADIVQTDDLLDAPNRFIVVGNSADASQAFGSIVGTYDIPNSAPNSIVNRGFVITNVLQMQLSTPVQAKAMATMIGIQSSVYERYALTTFADPRHDSYNVIRWQGANWLELGWALRCDSVGAMQHLIRKTYSG